MGSLSFKQAFYLVPKGCELYDRMAAIIEAKKARHEEFREFCREIGAESYSWDSNTLKLRGVSFREVIPKGWKKPNKHGLSLPRKDNKDPRIEDLFGMRQKDGYFSSGWWKPMIEFEEWIGAPSVYHYDVDEGSGSTVISLSGTGIYHIEDEFLLTVTDTEYYRVEAEKKGERVKDNVLDWDLNDKHPEAKRILREEWDLKVAQYKQKLAQEKAA